MKNMTSLMKVEIILMKRQAVYYLLSIGLPSVFYLIFSGMMSGSDIPEIALQAYLFAMTLFSIMSSAFSVSQAHSSLIRQTTGKIDSTFSRIYGRILCIKTVQHSAYFLVINYSCLFSWSFCPRSDATLA